jgi:hypothetical protein
MHGGRGSFQVLGGLKWRSFWGRPDRGYHALKSRHLAAQLAYYLFQVSNSLV